MNKFVETLNKKLETCLSPEAVLKLVELLSLKSSCDVQHLHETCKAAEGFSVYVKFADLLRVVFLV